MAKSQHGRPSHDSSSVAEAVPRDGPQPAPECRRTVVRLEWIALAGLAAAVWSTWPLWTGQHQFPQIPWTVLATGVPRGCDPLLLLASALLAAVALIPVRSGRAATVRAGSRAAFSIVVLALLLLDQHRLQPWVVHLLTLLWLVWLAPTGRGLSMARAVAISIYLYSSLSRLDVDSLELHWELLSGVLERFGIAAPFALRLQRLTAGAAFSACELIVAVLLAHPAARRWGMRLSLVMHATVLIALGPLGLDHFGGVLAWNAAWMAQNLVLFSPAAGGTNRERVNPVRQYGAQVLTAVVLLGPLLATWGWWDHWPSWRLYSRQPELVMPFVHTGRVPDLPPAVRAYVGPPEPLSEWRPINLDAWSFAETNSPMYPQARFRLAVIAAVAERARLGNDVRIIVRGPPERWSGRREQRIVQGQDELTRALDAYVVNVTERGP